MRVRLTIAYDGAPFAGWQSQAAGDSVQDAIERALAKIAKTKITLHGAGRTDAGVHALGQSAHFDAPEDARLTIADWLRALNGNLPGAIRIVRARRTNEDFHARFSARGKLYRYEIRTGATLPPHEFRRAWHVPRDLDVARLRETVAIFSGPHDFHAFSANRGSPPKSTVRRIATARVRQVGTRVAITFEGDGFLYKMVRMLVGAGVRVARGREPLARVRALLDDPSSGRWTYVAPADGLHLVRVLY